MLRPRGGGGALSPTSPSAPGNMEPDTPMSHYTGRIHAPAGLGLGARGSVDSNLGEPIASAATGGPGYFPPVADGVAASSSGIEGTSAQRRMSGGSKSNANGGSGSSLSEKRPSVSGPTTAGGTPIQARRGSALGLSLNLGLMGKKGKNGGSRLGMLSHFFIDIRNCSYFADDFNVDVRY